MKTIILTSLLLTNTTLFANNCSDKFTLDFTFFGATDKSYVVKKNKFKTIKSTFPFGKLENASIEIDLLSIDTSEDLNNGTRKWPISMAKVRDMNIKNGLFKVFTIDPKKAIAKITKVNANSVNIDIKINGVTQNINMTTTIDADTLEASGKLDVAKFSSKAWNKFSTICRGFHKGKSWSEIDVFFTVPASCK